MYMGALTALVLLFSGCSLVGAEDELMRVGVVEIQGPERAAPGAPITFVLTGFALDASIRVERRTDHAAELTAWAPAERQPDGWCATPPLPQIGRFETRAPAAGAYVLRFLQPDGTVLEKRVEVEG